MSRRPPLISVGLIILVVFFLYTTNKKYRSSDTLSRIQQYEPTEDPNESPKFADVHATQDGDHPDFETIDAVAIDSEHAEDIHDAETLEVDPDTVDVAPSEDDKPDVEAVLDDTDREWKEGHAKELGAEAAEREWESEDNEADAETDSKNKEKSDNKSKGKSGKKDNKNDN